VAAIDSDFADVYGGVAQNFLIHFLRNRQGHVKGSVLPYWDEATGKLRGIDDFCVVQRPGEGNRAVFEIHEVRKGT
jgi:hypothetical protein